MNVLIHGQDVGWVRNLAKLCEQDSVRFYERENPGVVMELLVTDFPIEEMRKGMCKNIPFLVVSKERKEEKILEAFAKGAEDYMIYPVSPQIARARINGIRKRYEAVLGNAKSLEDKIRFTPNEYRILSYMMTYPGRVFSRSELLEGALTEDYEGIDRNVDNYVRQLRKKLEQTGENPEQIQTIYGVGYRYVPGE